jgi:hypothetical protein
MNSEKSIVLAFLEHLKSTKEFVLLYMCVLILAFYGKYAFQIENSSVIIELYYLVLIPILTICLDQCYMLTYKYN